MSRARESADNGYLAVKPNLIINPEFRINQRGAATRTTTSSAYNYDRWYYDGTYLYQGIEADNIYDTTYTLTWDGSSTCEYQLVSTATAAASVASSWSGTTVTNGTAFTLSSTTGNNLWFRFATDLLNLNKVCLNEGVDTTYFRRSIGEELALCQRYFSKRSIYESVQKSTVTQQYSTTTFTTQMRVSPSMTYSGFVDTDTSGVTFTSCAVSDKGIVYYTLGGAISIGSRFRINIDFDAEL